ncbi:polyadenylate-binding protein-interacting protein 2B-like isoform X2 [Patiria miniata]|uniref:Uncharacterized protein n=1 Tax=Patiria miniata TaxID=46514 RepID=A0A914B4X5_PATMI|nr:polyadenylate-binding protein-interacting protein 2B-like isoform X2 [Patiria miniata]
MEKSSTGSGDGAENDPNKDKDTAAMTTSNEQDNPFAEYMWMGDPKEEDEVNLQVMEEILEEEFIESCFEDMLEEEALGLFTPPGEEPGGDGDDEIIPALHSLSLDENDAVADLNAVVDVESRDDENQDHEGDGWRGGANGSTPSGFGGQGSDGESENDSTP